VNSGCTCHGVPVWFQVLTAQVGIFASTRRFEVRHDLCRNRFTVFGGVRRCIGERQMAHVVHWDDMQMRVGDVKPGNHQTNAFASECSLLSPANALRHVGQMGNRPIGQVQPVIDFHNGNHKDVTPVDGIDVDEGDAHIVTMHERALNVATDDPGENGSHGAIVGG